MPKIGWPFEYAQDVATSVVRSKNRSMQASLWQGHGSMTLRKLDVAASDVNIGDVLRIFASEAAVTNMQRHELHSIRRSR